METILFILEALLLVAVIFLGTAAIEKAVSCKNGERTSWFTIRRITMIGVFSAVSAVLMLFELPLPFAPTFYKLDISEVPVLILTFAYGPGAGAVCELLKILIKLFLKGTSSAFVGELANFIIGCSFLLPAGICYLIRKTRKQAVISCVLGTLVMTVFGSFFNAVYLLPKFAAVYGMPLDSIVAMGTAINPAIDSVTALVLCCVVPMNLLKGALDSVITMLLYKHLSPVMKA